MRFNVFGFGYPDTQLGQSVFWVIWENRISISLFYDFVRKLGYQYLEISGGRW